MKKYLFYLFQKILILALICTTLGLAPLPGFAQGPPPVPPGGGAVPPPPVPGGDGAVIIDNPLQVNTFEELVENIINFIFGIALVFAPLMIIVGAFYFLTAAGDPKKLETAKAVILYTLVGLAIVIMAKGIIAVIKEIFGI